MYEDTIAAISTALSESGIGIVRISGPDAFLVISRIFHPASEKKDITKVPSQTIHYGYIYDKNELIDEVLVMIMRSPHTYTGEDTVEINCHGGIISMKKVLETVLKNGPRIAEPGEFTKRAFLSGRISLSEAEAVMDLIQAKNDFAMKNALTQLKGSVSGSIKQIRSELLYHIAYIETALDDPEHYDLSGYGEEIGQVVRKHKQSIDSLVKTFDEGRMIKEGIRTVILGKPNAGKSSLLNYLLGENRAIVTDIAGTTRDVLEDYINLNGISLHIIDTAGIRNTEDKVEKIGVERAKEAARDADLILYVVDSSTPFDDNDQEIIRLLKNKKVIVIYNKTDLSSAVDQEEIEKITGFPVIPLSALLETGKENLEKQIQTMFFGGELVFNDEVIITNARHKEALRQASESLSLVLSSIENQMPEDFITIDLMDACDKLGSITGESVREDVINEIFSKFCVGK